MLSYSIMTTVLTAFLAVSASAAEDEVIVDSNIVGQKGRPKLIDPLSIRPLYLIQLKGNEPLGIATGFVVMRNKKAHLITNWHVVTGRHPVSNKVIHPSGSQPDGLFIWHHGKQLGEWFRGKEGLYDVKGKRRWLEHKNGRKVDVVALPLESVPKDAQIYPLDLALADANMVPEVAMPVSIIGFPLGLTSAGKFPIWKTGHIASEPALDHDGQPLFLIDATTRAGMSGSPVVLRLSSGYKTKDGDARVSSSYTTLFLGVYSGRLAGDSEIGCVWRPALITEILK